MFAGEKGKKRPQQRGDGTLQKKREALPPFSDAGRGKKSAVRGNSPRSFDALGEEVAKSKRASRVGFELGALGFPNEGARLLSHANVASVARRCFDEFEGSSSLEERPRRVLLLVPSRLPRAGGKARGRKREPSGSGNEFFEDNDASLRTRSRPLPLSRCLSGRTVRQQKATVHDVALSPIETTCHWRAYQKSVSASKNPGGPARSIRALATKFPSRAAHEERAKMCKGADKGRGGRAAERRERQKSGRAKKVEGAR
ncbi:hypothetical protein KM043_012323 [Ampulex compressa]|nr:hypothetical protein KM043_012323 [Ampulex compressa]